ncbi:hypothetical protein GCM10023340_28850 [Nocardioides marinquilinus]|uniref:Zinc-ribbon domain-containing protein n=1 Tax=Nocardioides marinquilinus TaxID=1210400 RepID=A0ABP9PRF8_9ACTN
MIFIWGWKSYATLVASGNLVCAQCHNPAAHRLHRVRNKFTFFWIPLFTTSTKHHLDCTFCGLQTRLSQDEADRCAADLRSSHGQQAPSSPQQVPPQHP